jgi:hypothetical protein
MHISLSLDRSDDRYANIRYILEDLNTFVVHLAPHSGIGNIAEGREVDRRDELAAGSRKNHDLVGAILRYSIESLDKVGMVLRRKGKWTALRVELGNQDSLRIPGQPQTTEGAEIGRLVRWHEILQIENSRYFRESV